MGALLFPALLLTGCNQPNTPNKPEKPNEKNTLAKDDIGVVIENVTVDGVPVSMDELRAVGRTDIVKHTGNPNGEDLIQLKWKDVTRTKKLPVWLYAKPNLYLKDFKYRYRPKENEAYKKIPLNLTTYNSKDPLKDLSGDKPIYVPTIPVPEDDKNVYVTLDYGKVGDGDNGEVGNYDVIASLQFDNIPVTYVVRDDHGSFQKRFQYMVRPISVILENTTTQPLDIDFIELDVSFAPKAIGYLMLYKHKKPAHLSEWARSRKFRGGKTATLRSDERVFLRPKEKRAIQFWVDFSRPVGALGGPVVYPLKRDKILRNIEIVPFADGQTGLDTVYPWAKCVVDYPQNPTQGANQPEPPFIGCVKDIRLWKNDDGGIILNLNSTINSVNGAKGRSYRLLPPAFADLREHLGVIW